LAQAAELVLGFVCNGNGQTIAATSPNLLGKTDLTGTGSNTESIAIGYQVVAATTAVIPSFTGGGNTNGTVGTLSFKQSAAVSNKTTLYKGKVTHPHATSHI
jgi:hypothetical protein